VNEQVSQWGEDMREGMGTRNIIHWAWTPEMLLRVDRENLKDEFTYFLFISAHLFTN
jgi:hypothetical protein